MSKTPEPASRLVKYAILILIVWLFAAWFAFVWAPERLFAQAVGGSTQSLANPLKVQQFFDSAAFFLIKTVGMVVGIIALAISIFAAKFGRGSFGNIASVCFYIGLLFLAPSIVQLLSIFAGIGF
jgi:hypothetical protein